MESPSPGGPSGPLAAGGLPRSSHPPEAAWVGLGVSAALPATQASRGGKPARRPRCQGGRVVTARRPAARPRRQAGGGVTVPAPSRSALPGRQGGDSVAPRRPATVTEPGAVGEARTRSWECTGRLGPL